jgi:hypothetical protein
MFEELVWADDRVILNGLTFLLEGRAKPQPGQEDDGLWLYKDKALLDEYGRLFAGFPDLHVRNCLELGIWKGGSAAFWMEVLQAEKLIAIDFKDREDEPELRRYVKARGFNDRLKTYWRTDQADRARLIEIVQSEFDRPLDIVIDDASHAYAPTKSSFETLFPLLHDRGLYVIEDWPWLFSPHFRADFPASEPGLVRLIVDLAELLVAAPGLIRRIDIRRPFFALERGVLTAEEAREKMSRLWHDGGTIQPTESLALTARRFKRRLVRWIRGLSGDAYRS